MRLALLALPILAACTPEDERSCFDRLNADFGQYATRASDSGDHAGAMQAHKSALSASLIWTDDDRNACDYVSAGPFLTLK